MDQKDGCLDVDAWGLFRAGIYFRFHLAQTKLLLFRPKVSMPPALKLPQSALNFVCEGVTRGSDGSWPSACVGEVPEPLRGLEGGMAPSAQAFTHVLSWALFRVSSSV